MVNYLIGNVCVLRWESRVYSLDKQEAKMLNITKEKENEKLTFCLEGKLDSVTSNDLESEIMGSLEGVEELIVNCEKLEYVSSAGLRVLLAALKLMNKQGTMKVTNVCDEIMSIFDMTGFSEILTIENGLKEETKKTAEAEEEE